MAATQALVPFAGPKTSPYSYEAGVTTTSDPLLQLDFYNPPPAQQEQQHTGSGGFAGTTNHMEPLTSTMLPNGPTNPYDVFDTTQTTSTALVPAASTDLINPVAPDPNTATSNALVPAPPNALVPTDSAPSEIAIKAKAEQKEVDERLKRMKTSRKTGQRFAAASGAVVGLVALGPLGAAVGGVAAHQIAKHSGRARERRARRKLEGKIVQDVPILRAALA